MQHPLEGGTFTCPVKAKGHDDWRCEYQEGHPGAHVQHVPKFPGKSLRIWPTQPTTKEGD